LVEAFCIIKPLADDTDSDGVITEHGLQLHFDLPNSRRIMHEKGGPGTMSVIHCKGPLPEECSHPSTNLTVNREEDCPVCPCEQDLSRDLDFGYNKAAWKFLAPSCSKKLRVLHIGICLGAFVTYVAGNCKESKNDVIDLDTRTMKLTKEFYGAKWDDEHAMPCDEGVKHLLAPSSGAGPEAYDFIMLDTYDHNSQVPMACRSSEFAQDVRNLLAPGGHLLANLWQREEWGKGFDAAFGQNSSQSLGSSLYAFRKDGPERSKAGAENVLMVIVLAAVTVFGSIGTA